MANKVKELIYYYTVNPHKLDGNKYSAAYIQRLQKFKELTKEQITFARQEARNKSPHIEGGSTYKSFNNGEISSSIELTFEPQSVKELASLHKIDLNTYKISQYWSKLKPNGKFTSSILASLKKVTDLTGEDIIKTLSTYKSSYKPISKKNIFLNTTFQHRNCVFIDITDFHIDKLDIFNTPINKKIEQFYNLTKTLLYKAYLSNSIEKIVLVIGSDFLHTDNFFNQTTKGTQQEVSVRWNESFDIAFDIYANTINMMKQFCSSLDIILVAGNHSRTKEYYLAFALKKYFETDKNIHFDISPSPRKVFVYGNTFIGLHHGNTKIEQLPLVFSKEFRKEWGKCKYHEIKVGDKHFFMERDYAGVRIKQLPACTNPDTWLNDNNYNTSEQSAICSVYHYEKGRCMDIEEKI